LSKDNKKRWKYVQGYHVGDIIDFGNTNYFRIDSSNYISKGGKNVAKVTKFSKKELYIVSFSGETGVYIRFD
jgi:hypothetical protein